MNINDRAAAIIERIEKADTIDELLAAETELRKLSVGKKTGVAGGSVLAGVLPGNKVRVTASIQYKGPALTDTFYVAIGNRIVAFDEIWVGTSPISWPASSDWVTYTPSADVSITKVANLPWTPGYFDIYCKLQGHLGAGLPEYANVIQVLLGSEFQNFGITKYEIV